MTRKMVEPIIRVSIWKEHRMKPNYFRLGSVAERACEEKEMTISPERVAQIRKRIREGAYNSTEIADRVARAMLARGDI